MNPNIPTFWWHVAQVVIGLTILGCFIFQFTRATTTQKTVVQSGGTKVDYWQGSTIKPAFGGCAIIKTERLKETK